MHRDPYDVTVAFDDLYGDEVQAAPDRADVVYATRQIIGEVSKWRLPPPPMTFEVLGDRFTGHSFEFPRERYEVLGADEAARYPLFRHLRSRFAHATPPPRAVRLDTEESYLGFRDERRLPYIARFEDRLSALEDAFYRHASDDHAARLADLEGRFDRHVSRIHGFGIPFVPILGGMDAALREIAVGGTEIPLLLPPWARGKITCWQDGHEILCTVRLPGPDGRARLATTGRSVAESFDEVVGAAYRAAVPPEAALPMIPTLAQVLGGGVLIPQVCKVAPEVLRFASECPVVGLARPASQPEVAAAMTLLQRAQLGDRQALTEAAEIAHTQGALVADAGERLTRAQLKKRRSMS